MYEKNLNEIKKIDNSSKNIKLALSNKKFTELDSLYNKCKNVLKEIEIVNTGKLVNFFGLQKSKSPIALKLSNGKTANLTSSQRESICSIYKSISDLNIEFGEDINFSRKCQNYISEIKNYGKLIGINLLSDSRNPKKYNQEIQKKVHDSLTILTKFNENYLKCSQAIEQCDSLMHQVQSLDIESLDKEFNKITKEYDEKFIELKKLIEDTNNKFKKFGINEEGRLNSSFRDERKNVQEMHDELNSSYKDIQSHLDQVRKDFLLIMSNLNDIISAFISGIQMFITNCKSGKIEWKFLLNDISNVSNKLENLYSSKSTVYSYNKIENSVKNFNEFKEKIQNFMEYSKPDSTKGFSLSRLSTLLHQMEERISDINNSNKFRNDFKNFAVWDRNSLYSKDRKPENVYNKENRRAHNIIREPVLTINIADTRFTDNELVQYSDYNFSKPLYIIIKKGTLDQVDKTPSTSDANKMIKYIKYCFSAGTWAESL